ncbi:BamA/TamA family outer membrane protein [Arcticibacter sp. MXS-1]|uniref:translocation and assembly module lipoprotein TamL n=1 Tax=Arcticibacter sp. MXS-1 TaxID=3341726 RepID=UPI0035A8D3CD
MAVILDGCSGTRYLNEDQALVKDVKLKGVDKELREDASLYIQQDIMPNSRFNLALFNFFNTRHGKYKTTRLKNIGEAPHLLDSSLVDISTREIQKFLVYKGYFKARVTNEIKVKKKKAYITFTAEQGPAFSIRNFTYEIPDTTVRSLYEKNRAGFTQIRSGNRYDADSVMNEINSTYTLLKDNGYYDFVKQYIHVGLDSSLSSSRVDVKLQIYNPPGKTTHRQYYINNETLMTIRTSTGRMRNIRPDTAVIDSHLYFRDYSHRFRYKPLSRYIFLDYGAPYSVTRENLTYDRLYELNVFRTLKIEYEKDPDSSSLNVTIDASPLKRMSNRVEGEYTFNSGRNGFNIGNTYTNRNLFGGAEQLDVKLRYGIMFDNRGGRSVWGNVFNRDFQLGVNLIIPRLLVPFRVPSKIGTGIPHTTFSSSMQLFNQPGAFRNRLYINSITYDWLQDRNKLHSLTPVNVEYRDGRLDPKFKDSIRARGYEAYIKTNDRRYFNLGSIYTYTYNANKLNSYNDFFYFRGLTDLGGNTFGLVAKLLHFEKDSLGFRNFLGLRYLQYTKGEIDLRYYKHLGGERQLVARINPGIVVPYGNTYGNTDSVSIPFERMFYAGGFSGVRAWQARTLGPGRYNRSSIETEEARKNLTFLDQYGEIKLEGNVEYRFKIMNSFLGAKLKGASFVDFGNVWRYKKTQGFENGEFRFGKFLDQVAIGAGAGLRFDLQYFVFRLDVGAKVKDPQFSDQWVVKHLFSRSSREEFKAEYSRTNSPDQYRFLQYNFGIGMPF